MRPTSMMIATVTAVLLASSIATAKDIRLLNVSYDPTRELYNGYTKAFAQYWKEKTDDTVTVR